MSKTFLSYVAEDIITKYGTDLSRTAVVFPNKRASLFLNKELERIVGRPIWSPAYMTISDFFRAHSELAVADPIKLVCDLHKSFTTVTGEEETLDHFYGWGQLLIADFDDIDKNMADPAMVLANVSDLHAYDDVSYLTEEQKELLKRFFSNFCDDQNSRLKANFLRLWSRLHDIYTDFNARLEEQGLAYEGQLYRRVAAQKDLDLRYDRYLFVGFNLLQKVEQTLFLNIRRQGKGFFYWDFDHYYMHDNEAGHFIKAYLGALPNELDSNDDNIYDNMRRPKHITFAQAPTANLQAKYAAEWLGQNHRAEDGEQTAIVMCDETLLPTVIHSLPPEVEQVNITTGYPLGQTPAASLVGALLTLYDRGQASGDRWRLHYVNPVLRHPLARYLSPEAKTMAQELNEGHVFYPRASALSADEGLKMVFSPFAAGDDLLDRLTRIVSHVARNVGEGGEPLLEESLFSAYTLLNRLHELQLAGDLSVTNATLERLIGQLVRATSIPFHGEPAVGLQVMGVLETRNLDFRHLLLLGCDEGNMPKGVDDSSFIPHAIRRAYGLTTIDYKVAVYAHYFYRMLQRADDITIVYTTATTNGKQSEMSRFMMQLMVEGGHDIERLQLKAGQTPRQTVAPTIDKGPEVVERLRKLAGFLSPTAINHYLRCQLVFYYCDLCGIQQPNDNDDNQIDSRTFGNIFHLSAQIIYDRLARGGGRVTAEAIKALLKHPEELEMIVDEAFKEKLFNIPPEQAFKPEYSGLQLINREVILHYLRQLMEIDQRLGTFSILGLEKRVSASLGGIRLGGEPLKVVIGGFIDRLDQVGQQIRVIDYKTGARTQSPLGTVADIFSPTSIGKHSDYYLQAMLYSMIVRHSAELNPGKLPVSPCLLFIQHAGGDDYDPTLSLGREKINDVETYYAEFKASLTALVAEMFDTSHQFAPTANRDTCRSCAYRQLCGRM